MAAEHIEKPFDLSGTWKVIETQGIEDFLRFQGAPWPARQAAKRTKPTNIITHEEGKITVNIQGMINQIEEFQIGTATSDPIPGTSWGKNLLDRCYYEGNQLVIHRLNEADRTETFIRRELREDGTLFMVRM